MSIALGIECSGASLSVGIIHDQEPLVFEQITALSGYPEILVPTVQKVMKKADISYQNLDLIAAGRGPGSFTGERIALATASAIALALNKKAAGVSGFATSASMIKEEVRKEADVIVVSIETRRDDFYIATFTKDLIPIDKPASLSADKINLQGNVILAGDAANRLASVISLTSADIIIAKDTTPNAITVAKYALTHPDFEMPLTPLYISPAHVTCPS